jgi:aspartate-semialdehyde dehydrogenase
MPLPTNPIVAIVGATGAVGAELIGCLEQRSFPLSSLKLLASGRSAGRAMGFRGGAIAVQALDERAFEGVDLALFAVDADTARTFVPIALQAGAVVVDNSSAFRLSHPLIVPEINGTRLRAADGGRLVANPNCTAIIACMALAPIQRRFGLRRVLMSSYQAASGAGAPAMAELLDSTRAYLEGRPFTPTVLPHPYAFNVFSHNDAVDLASGYNGEEQKVMAETRILLDAPALPVGITSVRVPVLRAHAISIVAELDGPVDVDAVRAVLVDAPGVRLVDDRAANHFPMPAEAQNQGEVLAGRVRVDASDPSGRSVALFVAGDQLLKGAALNAVQIAEALLP